DKVDKGALEELAKALKQGITEEELAQFTKGYLLEAKAERGSDEHVVAVLRDGLYLGRTFSYYADLESKIAKLTVADVNRALRANLNPERLVIIRAGDFKMASGGKKKAGRLYASGARPDPGRPRGVPPSRRGHNNP